MTTKSKPLMKALVKVCPTECCPTESGDCERCSYPMFREKYESDLLEARDMQKTAREEMNRRWTRKGGVK